MSNFLKDQDVSLHDQYVMERYKQGLTGKGTNTANPVFNFPKPKFKPKNICSELIKISDLNKEHFARGYLLGRGISNLSGFYFCPNFKEWTNKHKQTFDNIEPDEPRIIIPLIDEDGTLFGYQGRSLNFNSQLRYITVILDEDFPKVYGLNQINKNETVYVTEGPFDSTFIRNSVAMCGADVDLSDRNIGDLVYVYDNEPRNKQIIDRISKSIDKGYKVVIWEDNLDEKDLNEMVLSGLDVQSMVESNTYHGLEAKLKLNIWKRV